MRLQILGEVRAQADRGRVDLGPARQRSVLAALAVDVNRLVPFDVVAERVWGQKPPLRARGSVSSYLSRLRNLVGADGDIRIVSRSGGYALLADEEAIDLHLFRALLVRARACGDDAERAALLEQATGLWHGEALAGLGGDWPAAVRAALEQERFAARLAHNEVLVRLGQHARVVPELAELAQAEPFDERLAEQMMLALHGCGRSADALEHYLTFRSNLVNQLGIEPGERLRQVHGEILGAGADGPPEQTPGLPAPPRWFVGRTRELAALTAAFDSGALTAVVHGVGGIGKTSLALQWGQAFRDRFPDGQLYVDLHGFAPSAGPSEPGSVVAAFLESLGVPSRSLPIEPQARVALYRRVVAGRRMLVVLDNAWDSDQVTTLLPGTPSCSVIVTSRRKLTTLVAKHNAVPVHLDVLDAADARRLLAGRLREVGRTDEVDRLLAPCGGLPLALTVTSARATLHPAKSLVALADELSDVTRRLDALDGGEHDSNLRAVFSWSYAALPADQASLLRLLGLAPVTSIGTAAASSLAGRPATALLRGLEAVSLVQEAGQDHWTMHDLVRLYAAEQANEEEQSGAAMRRLVDFYLHSVYAADSVISPMRRRDPLDAPEPGCVPRSFADRAQALEWLRAEYAGIVAVLDFAARQGRDVQVVKLARALNSYLYAMGNLQEIIAVPKAGLAAAERSRDLDAQAYAHVLLGQAYRQAEDFDRSATHLETSLALYRRHGTDTDVADVLHAIAAMSASRGDMVKSLHCAQEALGIYRERDEPLALQARLHNAIGWAHGHLGDYEQARSSCAEALRLGRVTEQTDVQATTLDSLGFVARREGDLSRALECYRDALALFRELGHAYHAADVLTAIGEILAVQGSRAEARTAWTEAAEMYRVQGREKEATSVDRLLA